MAQTHAELVEELKQKFPESQIFDIFELIDRKDFIPGLNSIDAYKDKPISIGSFQNSISPSTAITLCNKLDLKENLSVLEIGSGSGYMSACVYKKIQPGNFVTIEREKNICMLAKHNLKAKFPEAVEEKRIRFLWENGILASEKFPHHLFDRIYFTMAVDLHRINLEGFTKLLKPEGLLVIPVEGKKLHIYTKSQREKPFLLEESEFPYTLDKIKAGKR